MNNEDKLRFNITKVEITPQLKARYINTMEFMWVKLWQDNQDVFNESPYINILTSYINMVEGVLKGEIDNKDIICANFIMYKIDEELGKGSQMVADVGANIKRDLESIANFPEDVSKGDFALATVYIKVLITAIANNTKDIPIGYLQIFQHAMDELQCNFEGWEGKLGLKTLDVVHHTILNWVKKGIDIPEKMTKELTTIPLYDE